MLLLEERGSVQDFAHTCRREHHIWPVYLNRLLFLSCHLQFSRPWSYDVTSPVISEVQIRGTEWTGTESKPRKALLTMKHRVPGEIWILVFVTAVISLLSIWVQRRLMTMLSHACGFRIGGPVPSPSDIAVVSTVQRSLCQRTTPRYYLSLVPRQIRTIIRTQTASDAISLSDCVGSEVRRLIKLGSVTCLPNHCIFDHDTSTNYTLYVYWWH